MAKNCFQQTLTTALLTARCALLEQGELSYLYAKHYCTYYVVHA